MKRLCIALSLIFLLTGCAGQSPTNSPEPVTTPVTTQESEFTGNIFLDAEEQRHGTGQDAKPITYTITVQKPDALAATADEYSEFLSQRVETAKSLGLAESYTMRFEDGTGVIYYGADPNNAQYGLVDENGGIVEPYGAVVPLDDGSYSYVPFDDEQEGDSETDASIQALLEKIFDIDGLKTVVGVADGEANVWLIGNITIPTEADKKTLTSSLHELYDVAEDLMDTILGITEKDNSYSLSVTLCSSKNIPLYCIKRGEVAFDILTVG